MNFAVSSYIKNGDWWVALNECAIMYIVQATARGWVGALGGSK